MLSLTPLHFPHPIKQEHKRHHQLPDRTRQQRKRTPHRPISPRPRKTPRHEKQQEQQPQIPRSVPPRQKPRIHKHIHKRRRRHRSRDLRDLQRPTIATCAPPANANSAIISGPSFPSAPTPYRYCSPAAANTRSVCSSEEVSSHQRLRTPR